MLKESRYGEYDFDLFSFSVKGIEVIGHLLTPRFAIPRGNVSGNWLGWFPVMLDASAVERLVIKWK